MSILKEVTRINVFSDKTSLLSSINIPEQSCSTRSSRLNFRSSSTSANWLSFLTILSRSCNLTFFYTKIDDTCKYLDRSSLVHQSKPTTELVLALNIAFVNLNTKTAFVPLCNFLVMEPNVIGHLSNLFNKLSINCFSSASSLYSYWLLRNHFSMPSSFLWFLFSHAPPLLEQLSPLAKFF